MHERNSGKGTVVDLGPARVRSFLADLRAADWDLDTRRRLDVELRKVARDERFTRYASSIYATARALRAPCRNATR